MIRNILVMTRAGKVVIDRTYVQTHSTNRQLIGNFLWSIVQFGSEAFNDPQVHEITFEKQRILLQCNSFCWVVGIIDLADDVAQVNHLLTRISDEVSKFQSFRRILVSSIIPSQHTLNQLEQAIERLVIPYMVMDGGMHKSWTNITKPPETTSPAT